MIPFYHPIGGFGLASDEATVSLIENKEMNLFDDLLPTDSINQIIYDS